MKKLEPDATVKENRDLKYLTASKSTKIDIRVGSYYSKLKPKQRLRFDRLVDSLCRNLGLNKQRNPLELILVRFVAINSLRIEYALEEIIDNSQMGFQSKHEKWILQAQRETDNMLKTLSLLSKKALSI